MERGNDSLPEETGNDSLPEETGKGSLPEETGKESLPDFINGLLDDPRRAFRFLAFSGACLGLVALVVCAALWFLQWREILPNEAKIEGVEIHFSSTKTDKMRRYFFVVHPQGWQQTPVRLNKGDHFQIYAAGSITIDMWGISAYSTQRDAIDRAIKKHASDVHQWTDNVSTPEDFYNRKEYAQVMEDALATTGAMMTSKSASEIANVIDRIKPARGWTGPKGYAENPMQDTAYVGRSRKRVGPDFRYGALLGTVAPLAPNDCTTEEVLQFTERCTPKTKTLFSVVDTMQPDNPTADGEERALWLIVNDVLDNNPTFPEKFYVDNLGFFYVEVVVTPQ